jgi:N6-adenosine-specific RNA methylase IME4
MIRDEEFAELVADIKINGLQKPITVYEGKVLDGRNRFLACGAAEVRIRTEEYVGDEPLAYVLSANLRRRHLGASQRAMIAATLANMAQGARTDLQPSAKLPKVSQQEAARRLEISGRSLRDARVVRSRGSPSLAWQVEQGQIAVSLAAKLAQLPLDEQRNLVGADKATLRNAVKKATVIEPTEQTAGSSIASGAKHYSIVYADPWSIMTLYDLCALSVPAADNALLFLWAPVSRMSDAMRLMESWGFLCVEHFVWMKGSSELGLCARIQHETLLVGGRGDMPVPVPGSEQPSILIVEASGDSSSKPAAFLQIIAAMFPSVSKVELFVPAARPGWEAWSPKVGTHCARPQMKQCATADLEVLTA